MTRHVLFGQLCASRSSHCEVVNIEARTPGYVGFWNCVIYIGDFDDSVVLDKKFRDSKSKASEAASAPMHVTQTASDYALLIDTATTKTGLTTPTASAWLTGTMWSSTDLLSGPPKMP